MTEEQYLKLLEKRLESEYKDTLAVLRAKIPAYTKGFEKTNELYLKQLKSGEIDEKTYKAWYKKQVTTAKWCDDMIKEVSADITQTNVKASQIINGSTSEVYLYGCVEASGEFEDMLGFDLIDQKQVKKLVTENEPLLPKSKVNIPKDERWNQNRMRSAVLQSAIKGESIPKLAKRLENIVGMNRTSAVRNARTMMTASHNMGKLDTGYEAIEMGINAKKKWIATHDNRTRHSHILLDGETVEMDEEFSNGLIYPADPDGDPSEVYNCRCTMGYVIDEADKIENEILEEQEEMAVEEARQTEPENEVVKDNAFYQNESQEVLMDAYDTHRIQNGLESTSANELGKEFFNIDYGDINTETAKAFTEVISDLSQEYDTSLTEIRIMTSLEINKNAGAFASTFHNYEIDTSTMILNPNKIDDIERLKYLTEKGYMPKIPEENVRRYVATHEFAHTFVDMGTVLNDKRNWVGADYEKVKSVRKKVNGIYERYIKEIGEIESAMKSIDTKFLLTDDPDELLDIMATGKELGKRIQHTKISDYSMLNADEFMAEAFAHKKLGGNENKYVDEIMDVINENFRRN